MHVNPKIQLNNKAYLQEEGYDFSSTSSTCLLSGASAGALAATLAATDVNPYDATELALSLAEEAGVWTRPLGLQGVWGSIIYEWLDTLLPEDAEKRVAETVSDTILNSVICYVCFFVWVCFLRCPLF